MIPDPVPGPETPPILPFTAAEPRHGRGGRQRTIRTVAELFRDYLRRTQADQSPKTFGDRKALLDAFAASPVVNSPIEVYGTLPIAELVVDDLERWIEDHAAWNSDWTRLRAAGSLKRPFSWGCRKGLIESNPFSGVTYSQGERGQPIAEADFRSLLRASPPELRRPLLFMTWTGGRPCEVCSMTWDQIDCNAGVVIQKKHKTAKSRRDKAPRQIYLTDASVKLLIWIRKRGKEPRVFWGRRGKPLTTGAFQLAIWKLRKRLGLPADAKLYGCRHAWATRLAESGCVQLKTLAELLGHTTSKMAEHYIHLDRDAALMRDALRRGLAGQNGS
jgi:integrase